MDMAGGKLEKIVENDILRFLNMSGIFCWKNQSVGVYDPVKRVYRRSNNKFHINGTSDILGIFKGKPLAIEVKSSVGRATEEQKAFIEQFNLNGGIAFVARSVDDVRRELSI